MRPRIISARTRLSGRAPDDSQTANQFAPKSGQYNRSMAGRTMDICPRKWPIRRLQDRKLHQLWTRKLATLFPPDERCLTGTNLGPQVPLGNVQSPAVSLATGELTPRDLALNAAQRSGITTSISRPLLRAASLSNPANRCLAPSSPCTRRTCPGQWRIPVTNLTKPFWSAWAE